MSDGARPAHAGPTSPDSRAGALRIEARSVTRSFVKGAETIEVLSGIDLVLEPGSQVSIVGASGAGKSTLLHVLATLDRPNSGQILFGGHDVFALDDADLAAFRNRRIGLVFQFHHLLPEFTALENTMMPAVLAGVGDREARDAAKDMLAEVGLSRRLHHRPGELSGGEQQRVAVARALVMRPDLVLADEPTGNLDEKTGRAIDELLFRVHADRGASLVLVTHDLDLARRVPRRLRLHSGRLEEWS